MLQGLSLHRQQYEYSRIAQSDPLRFRKDVGLATRPSDSNSYEFLDEFPGGDSLPLHGAIPDGHVDQLSSTRNFRAAWPGAPSAPQGSPTSAAGTHMHRLDWKCAAGQPLLTSALNPAMQAALKAAVIHLQHQKDPLAALHQQPCLQQQQQQQHYHQQQEAAIALQQHHQQQAAALEGWFQSLSAAVSLLQAAGMLNEMDGLWSQPNPGSQTVVMTPAAHGADSTVAAAPVSSSGPLANPVASAFRSVPTPLAVNTHRIIAGLMSRSARQKHLFTELEAQVRAKRGEANRLAHENKCLQMKVCLLETAVERQDMLLQSGSDYIASEDLHAAESVPLDRNPMGLRRPPASAAATAAAEGEGFSLSPNSLIRRVVHRRRVVHQPAIRLSVRGRINLSPFQSVASNPAASSSCEGEAVAMVVDSSPFSPVFSSSLSASSSFSSSSSSSCFAGQWCPGSGAGSGVDVALDSEWLLSVRWAHEASPERFMAWYKHHLKDVRMALLDLDRTPSCPLASAALERLARVHLTRVSLVGLLNPLILLRLKGMNLETDEQQDIPESHWIRLVSQLTLTPDVKREMDCLWSTYQAMQEGVAMELAAAQQQQELAELGQEAATGGDVMPPPVATCGVLGMHRVLDVSCKQLEALRRVSKALRKTHLLCISCLSVIAVKIFKPTEYAKCLLLSYPFLLCGPSILKASEASCGIRQGAPPPESSSQR